MTSESERETRRLVEAARSGDPGAIRSALAAWDAVSKARDVEPLNHQVVIVAPAVVGLALSVILWRAGYLIACCVGSVVASSLLRSWRVWRARRMVVDP